MENTVVFRILILCAATLAVCQAELAITAKVSKSMANIGDDITVTCHITNEEGKQFYVNWVKKVGEHETEIGTNKKINKLYQETGRYSASVKLKTPKDISDVTFTLSINNVDASDSGEYGCKLPQMLMFVSETLTVISPLASLTMLTRHLDGTHEVTYQDGETTTFDEGEKRVFTCRATGAYPKPELKLMLGDEDITSQFNKTEELKKEGVAGLYALTYDVALINPNLEIAYEYSNGQIQCVATQPDTELRNTTSVSIELTGYKPQFVCDEVIRVPLHKEDVNITCHVHADPPILGNATEMYWERSSAGNDTILPGDSLGQLKAFLEGKDDYEKVMTLHIGHVYMHHFQTYFFQATNSLGTVTHGVQLRREPDYEHKPGENDAGKTGESSVPGTKDRDPNACGINRLLPGLLLTALLTAIII